MSVLPVSTEKKTDTQLAYLFLRVTLGVNIFIHGLARVLVGQGQFANTIIQGFHATVLPQPLVVGFAYSLPWLEIMIGAFVLLGLFTRSALSAGALLILVLTFGSTLRQDWESAGLQLTYAIVYAGLLAYRCNNRYSVDALLQRNK
jgi:thiosulfate dehydrogenase (quinone) large subunit